MNLAKKARALSARSNIAGWLYTSTRFAASKALRSRVRRINHETASQVMSDGVCGTSEPASWAELRPVLDSAMHELTANDREAILLRYFEGLSHGEVGNALGIAENTARMRVERALEKLRGGLQRRGITSTAAAIGAALVGQTAVSAPAGLAAMVAGNSLAGAAAATRARTAR